MIKQIERVRTANLCKSDHVGGMLSQEAFVTEDTNPLYGNTMPKFPEFKRRTIDSDEDDKNLLEIVEMRFGGETVVNGWSLQCFSNYLED